MKPGGGKAQIKTSKLLGRSFCCPLSLFYCGFTFKMSDQRILCFFFLTSTPKNVKFIMPSCVVRVLNAKLLHFLATPAKLRSLYCMKEEANCRKAAIIRKEELIAAFVCESAHLKNAMNGLRQFAELFTSIFVLLVMRFYQQ